MDLVQIMHEMMSNIKEICKTAGCPLNDRQLTHINNILIPYALKLSKQDEDNKTAHHIITTLLPLLPQNAIHESTSERLTHSPNT